MHHIGEMRLLNALFLVLLNLGNSIPQIRNIAEVDATGKVYISIS